jgi:hypothetical protein
VYAFVMSAFTAAGRASTALTSRAPEASWTSFIVSASSGSAVTTVSACLTASKTTGQTPIFSANRWGIMLSSTRATSAFDSFSAEMKCT